MDANNEMVPNSSRGSGAEYTESRGANGATMAPKRAIIEQAPIEAERNGVGYNSAVYT